MPTDARLNRVHPKPAPATRSSTTAHIRIVLFDITALLDMKRVRALAATSYSRRPPAQVPQPRLCSERRHANLSDSGGVAFKARGPEICAGDFVRSHQAR